MARTGVTILATLLLSCAPERPSTNYFSERIRDVEAKIKKSFGSFGRLGANELDPSAPADYAFTKYFQYTWYRAPWFPLPPDIDPTRLFGVGDFDIRIVGQHTYPDPVCGLHIGPTPVRGPLPIDFMFEMFDDPALAERVKAEVGVVDIEHAYEIDTMVDGFRIHFHQRQEGVVLLEIDGCGRVSPRERKHYASDYEIRFAGPTATELKEASRHYDGRDHTRVPRSDD
jgi:hypothetical protein